MIYGKVHLPILCLKRVFGSLSPFKLILDLSLITWEMVNGFCW